MARDLATTRHRLGVGLELENDATVYHTSVCDGAHLASDRTEHRAPERAVPGTAHTLRSSTIPLAKARGCFGRASRLNEYVVDVENFDGCVGRKHVSVAAQSDQSRDLHCLGECAVRAETRVPEHRSIDAVLVDVPRPETRVTQARISSRVQFRQRTATDEHVPRMNGDGGIDRISGLTVSDRHHHIPDALDPSGARSCLAGLALLLLVLCDLPSHHRTCAHDSRQEQADHRDRRGTMRPSYTRDRR